MVVLKFRIFVRHEISKKRDIDMLSALFIGWCWCACCLISLECCLAFRVYSYCVFIPLFLGVWIVLGFSYFSYSVEEAFNLYGASSCSSMAEQGRDLYVFLCLSPELYLFANNLFANNQTTRTAFCFVLQEDKAVYNKKQEGNFFDLLTSMTCFCSLLKEKNTKLGSYFIFKIFGWLT